MIKSVHPYLNFNGNTEEVFNFYKSVFGGEFLGEIYRFKDTPGMENLSPQDGNKVMHMALMLGGGVMLMGTDTLESMGQKCVPGNNFYIYLALDSKEEADRIFTALSEGGKVEMPMADVFWGDYYGAFADKFGTQWMLSYTKPKE